MNHAGEIRSLVGHRRARDSRVDQRRRRASRPLRVAGGDRGRQGRDSRGRVGHRCAGLQRRRSAVIAARAGAFAGRDDHASADSRARRRARRRRSRISASTARRFVLHTPDGDVDDAHAACSAAATCRTCSPPSAVATRARRAAATRLPTRAATLAAGAASRRGPAPGERHHGRRRLLQLEPDGPASARWKWSRARPDAARKAAVLGEMLELGEHSIAAARSSAARAAAAAGLDRLIAVGGDAGAGAGRRGGRGGHADRRGDVRRQSSAAAAELIVPWLRAGDLVLVKGSRGIKTDAGRGSHHGGVRLMLFHLLAARSIRRCRVFNVVRYITFRTAAASLTALVISLVLGPWLIRRLREFQIGQVIRQEGPQSHHAKAGTPTMGGLLILAAALVPTLLWADLTNVYVWIAVLGDRVVRRDRIPRRLPEDHAALVGRAAAAPEDGAADRRRARSSAWR